MNGIGVLAPCPSQPTSRMAELLLAALDSISTGPGGDTVWNRYDNDGPDGIPNSGDDDGVIDVVAFLQPGVDGACGAPGNPVAPRNHCALEQRPALRHAHAPPRCERAADSRTVPHRQLLHDPVGRWR